MEHDALSTGLTSLPSRMSCAECIHHLFEEQVERTPDAVALVHEDRQLTYRELNDRANELAAELKGLGVGPDVLVGICMLRSLEMVIGLYAIHKTGGAYVPMDPAYPAERLAFMLEDAQAPVLLTQQSLLETLPATKARIVCLDAPDRARTTHHAPRNTHPVTPENLAYVIYTSGSTGKPKGVMVRHRNVVNFFTGMDQALGREPGVWLAVTSISFDISVLELFWTLTRGFKVVLLGDEGAGARSKALLPQKASGNGAGYSAREQLLRHGVTHLQCTPSLAGMMVQDPKTMEALRHIKHLLFGGEPLPPALVQQLAGAGEIINLYGPTETTVWSTFYPVTRNGGRITIGWPIANTEVYLLDQHLQPVPVGAAGELFIGGAGVARGYLNRPDLTAERFVPDPFSGQPGARLYRTGDLARYGPDGTLEFLGRLDHQVKIRGFRIELGEIEAVLRQHPGVRESVVSVWEAGPNDRRLVGYYVAGSGPEPEPAELRRFLRDKLPEHMVPSVLMSLEALPLTPNGKIDRKALPVPQPSPSEPILVGRAVPSPPPEHKPGKETIEYTPQTPSEPLAGDHKDVTATLPLTQAQREIWYAAQISDAVSCSFNVSVMLNLRGFLDLARLSRSIRWLVDRHEALRVTFSPAGDAQHIHASVPVEVPLTDLSSLSPDSRHEQLHRKLEQSVTRPFDLVHGPLWRARLIRLAAEKHVLSLTAHHVVCDGHSLSVLAQELGEHYSAEAKAEPGPAEKPASFSEFVLSQEAALQSPERAAAEAFWLSQYSCRPTPVLELPTDRPRRSKRTFTGGSQALSLSPQLSQGLKRLSARQRCTRMTTLLAGYYLLLHRLSGQPEIIVGLPMTSRSGEGAERLVGHCVNFLPLRLSLEGDPAFTEHLDRVRRLLLDAHQHQNFTLGSLLQKLNLPRAPGRMPLASVMFNLDWTRDEIKLDGLETEIACNPHCCCRFDLTFNLAESHDRLEVQCQYSAELFDAGTIHGWLKDYEKLLEAIVRNPEQRLSELPWLASERQRPLREGSAPEALKPATPEAGVAEESLASNTPSNPTEETLAQIWCEVIVLNEVGRNDNFFDVGGHSLLATQVISRITKAFKVELPLRTIFEAPTIASLAEAVSRAQREQPEGASAITRSTREAKANKLLERLDQLSDAEIKELLQSPKLKDLLS